MSAIMGDHGRSWPAGMMRLPEKFYYHGQGGWDGYEWGGLDRRCFVFRDTLTAGGCLHASSYEGRIENWTAAAMRVKVLPDRKEFAGIVCVAD